MMEFQNEMTINHLKRELEQIVSENRREQEAYEKGVPMLDVLQGENDRADLELMQVSIQAQAQREMVATTPNTNKDMESSI